MKTCDVCGKRLGFVKFRYRDGLICKGCYETASRSCTETVRGLVLPEIKARCCGSGEQEVFEDFEITGRIGNFILMDDRRHKICIVNNRIQAKSYKKPEIVSLDQIRYCQIRCGSALSWEELSRGEKTGEGCVTSLGLELVLDTGESPLCIWILSSPVRIQSFAFRKSMDFMQLIVGYLQSNEVECRVA